MSSEPLHTPRDFVQSGWDFFREMGGTWITYAQQAIGDLTNLDIVPITFDDASLDLNVDYGSFVRPVKPDAPELDEISTDVPTAPEVEDVEFRDAGDAPESPDFSNLSFSPPTAPSTPLPTPPADDDVVLETIVIPEMDPYNLPSPKQLYELNIPDAPELPEVEFEAERPEFDFDAPDGTFNWQETAYSSDLMDSVKANLQSLIDGGLGLPAAIEQALFERGRERADTLGLARVQQAENLMASRGIYEGGGYMRATLEKARFEARTDAAGHNRDITIEAAKITVESVRFGLSQAATLEIALLQENSQINQRSLEAAKIAKDVSISVFNAHVSRYNLEVELFKADAQVFLNRIQANIARAEMFKAEIDAQKAIGEINEGLIRSYIAELQSIDTLANIYRSKLEAAKVAGEINVQRLEQARIKVQTYATRVEAWGKEQDGYRTQVEAAMGNVRMYEVVGNVYARRCEAFKSINESYFQQAQARIEVQKLGFAGFNAELEAARALLAAQVARNNSKAQLFSSQADMYSAEGQVAAAESAAQDRTNELRVRVATARLESILKITDSRINQNAQIYGLYVEQLKAKAQVVSQLAAATMSGVNFGASYSGSLNFGYQNSASLSWNGEAPDFGASYAGMPLF